jgi:phospholipase/lecithinase/hemolysin
MAFLLFGLFILPAQAAFTSFYVFGDALSTTTNNTSGGNYFGQSFSNGKVWVEVLAERQGITYQSNKNWSYFGDYSANLVANVNTFSAPVDGSTALFAVWVSAADLLGFWVANTMNASQWATALNQSQTNHLTAINTLYNKGARTLVMPSAVDISAAPYFATLSASQRTFLRQRAIDFNTGFAVTLNQARALHPDLVIYEPNLFSLVDDLMAHPGNYGLTKTNIDVLQDGSLSNKALNGPGTNYVFWDWQDPTAKVHEIIADTIQQFIWPVQISKIISFNGSNRLDVANVPIGRDGFVDGSTNFIAWDSDAPFDSTNATQSIFIPTSDPVRLYRLRFPFAWTWP